MKAAVAREDALQLIQFLLQYWPSKSPKFDDFIFYLMWNGEIWLVFRWKNAYFPIPIYSAPNLKIVSLALHPRNFARWKHWHRTNYLCKKFSSMTQHLSTIEPVESHSGARGNILAGLQTFSRGPSGEKIFEFFFSKWYILAYFINFWLTMGPPKRCGARGS